MTTSSSSKLIIYENCWKKRWKTFFYFSEEFLFYFKIKTFSVVLSSLAINYLRTIIINLINCFLVNIIFLLLLRFKTSDSLLYSTLKWKIIFFINLWDLFYIEWQRMVCVCETRRNLREMWVFVQAKLSTASETFSCFRLLS
jgi:hypothetical protein